MRIPILLLLLSLAAGGCASNFVYREAQTIASRIGAAESEVVALAKGASERHKRPIAWIRMSVAVDGAFEVGLSDRAGSPHGIAVVFRQVDGHWKEDPALQTPWII